MKTGLTVSTLGANFIVALGYILGGYVGDLLSFPPVDLSPVWPPSGIALAALLLYGKRILPGLLAGILIVQTVSFTETANLSEVLQSFPVVFVISIGSVLQALTGCYLIHRFVGRNDPLLENRKIIRFFFLGGPLSCLIAPAFGTIALLVSGQITGSESAFTYSNWWAGDTTGEIGRAHV